MKFNDYTQFQRYCLGIAKNKGHAVNKKNLHILNEFKFVASLLEELKDDNVIEIGYSIYNVIIYDFKKGCFDEAFTDMQYLIDEVDKFFKHRTDFRDIVNSLNYRFHISIKFKEDFLLNPESLTSIFYPFSVYALEIKDEKEEIGALSAVDEIDLNYKNKYGVYFIYNSENKLAYIGKSTSCLLRRAFESAQERECLDFSRIELRECKSKSDVAMYESYYISMYKPPLNNDLVFDDTVTVTLPALPISKIIFGKKENKKNIYTYKYYTKTTMSVKNFIDLSNKNCALLNTNKNIELLKSKGIHTKEVMKKKARKDAANKLGANCLSVLDCIRKLRDSN